MSKPPLLHVAGHVCCTGSVDTGGQLLLCFLKSQNSKTKGHLEGKRGKKVALQGPKVSGVHHQVCGIFPHDIKMFSCVVGQSTGMHKWQGCLQSRHYPPFILKPAVPQPLLLRGRYTSVTLKPPLGNLTDFNIFRSCKTPSQRSLGYQVCREGQLDWSCLLPQSTCQSFKHLKGEEKRDSHLKRPSHFSYY